MNGRERIEKAFLHEEPDRVPVWEMAFNEQSIIGIGRHFTGTVPPMKDVYSMTIEEKSPSFHSSLEL